MSASEFLRSDLEKLGKEFNLKSHKFQISTALVSAAVALMTASASLAYTGENLSKFAKVSIEQARATALKSHPGIITDEELEKERGGSGLRYSFDIKDGAKTYEVGVDAKTGKVLENAAEGSNPD
jgi:uncharacterized membrane protein YkoI